MGRWFLYLAIYIVAWVLNWFIAPIYSLFTANGWPIPKNGGKYAFVCAITPVKDWG
jgi:hypothetical protein